MGFFWSGLCFDIYILCLQMSICLVYLYMYSFTNENTLCCSPRLLSSHCLLMSCCPSQRDLVIGWTVSLTPFFFEQPTCTSPCSVWTDFNQAGMGEHEHPELLSRKGWVDRILIQGMDISFVREREREREARM